MLSSAQNLLSLLDENEVELQKYALETLNDQVDTFWHEIASSIPKIEVLYEDETFQSRDLAAAVASKVYYHLEELDESLKFALSAGPFFDVETQSEYVETLLSKCIDEYVSLQTHNFKSPRDQRPIDPRLANIVERMFTRCYNDGKYKQAIGVAIESHRLDHLRRSITESGSVKEMLKHCVQLSQTVITSRAFRQQVMRLLVDLYRELDTPDYLNMCQLLLFLDDSDQVAAVLDSLLQKSLDDTLIAYQVAFELHDNQNQPFLQRVLASLPSPEPVAQFVPSSTSSAAASSGASASVPSDPSAGTTSTAGEEEEDDQYPTRVARLKSILSAEVPINFFLHFLYSKNATDPGVLNHIKNKLEQRNSVTHHAAVVAHAFSNCGTTNDNFLRENLTWLGKAKNWAKFTATASIGVIHKGHHKESLKLLELYLPQGGAGGSSPYQEGGALFALGLIHSNHTAFLMNSIRSSGDNEIVLHGACLGLGLAAMATGDQAVQDQLKDIVTKEYAVAGDAAGLALGLVLIGSDNGDSLSEMLAYAHDTKHEKTLRGLAMGIALACYAKEEEADGIIEQLCLDKDPVLRYGGMYALALAYVGTANNPAIQRLLHVAVSDVSDDVRRAAVTALGFVLANNPAQVPRIVSLLAESYNFHVRYGACLAVGIACASTGLKSAVTLLEPMLKDRVDIVRQGAYIALSMVHIQGSDAKAAAFRKDLVAETSGVKPGDTMTKLGAIIAAGIIDAGGRNTSISLLSAAGHKKMEAIIGMAIFPQYWYWYPYTLFLSLSFSPTAIIGLNRFLKMPKDFQVQSNAKPSMFAYPAPLVEEKKEEKHKVKTATLSVTAKAKARQMRKMDLDGTTPLTLSRAGTRMSQASKVEEPVEEAKVEEPPPPPEPEFHLLSNPARVTLTQQSTLQQLPGQRYIPCKERLVGVVMLKDSMPDRPEEFVVSKQPKIGIPGISEDEPAPPADFEFTRRF